MRPRGLLGRICLRLPSPCPSMCHCHSIAQLCSACGCRDMSNILLRSPLPHLRRDCAHPCHNCTGTGLTPATSAPGLGSPLPHLRRNPAHRLLNPMPRRRRSAPKVKPPGSSSVLPHGSDAGGGAVPEVSGTPGRSAPCTARIRARRAAPSAVTRRVLASSPALSAVRRCIVLPHVASCCIGTRE